MTPRLLRLLSWVILIGIDGASLAFGQMCYPMLARVEPTAIQRGQSATLTITGKENFAGASALLFEGSGITAEITDPGAKGKPATSIKARLTVAETAALGPREFRVVTPQGVSSAGLVVIVADPVATEADDKANDTPAGSQAVPLPSVATGLIGKVEDVDWYRLNLKAGDQLTVRVWGNRLENTIHDLQTHFDPIVILHDADGRELASDDNAEFADPRLHYQATRSGSYLLEIRDTSYAGNANWTYVLQATTGPVPTAIFPMAVTPGSNAELRAIGPNIDPEKPWTVPIPEGLPEGPAFLPIPTDGGPSLPVWMVSTRLPLAAETTDTAARADQAATLAIPSATSGRLADPNDVDAYRFEAKKGELFQFEVMARRAGSLLDPVLQVLNADGKGLVQVDDTHGKDPALEWSAPADGTYAVAVRDLHSRGGPGFGYVLLARKAEPDFTLTCDPDKVNLGPGSRSSVFVKLERRGGFTGAVTLEWQGLPKGVTASPLTIPPRLKQGEIVLSADKNLDPAGSLTTLVGKAETPSGELRRAVQPRQEIYLPGGGRGLQDVATLPVAITTESDITVEAAPSEIVLKPGETATIDVTVKRRSGFDKPVNLAVELAHLGRVYGSSLPPGVTVKAAGSKTLLDGKTTTGKIILEAKSDAPAIDKVPIAVMGHISINFVVKSAYSSAPILISVAGPKSGD